jgi:hypothetical protein
MGGPWSGLTRYVGPGAAHRTMPSSDRFDRGPTDSANGSSGQPAGTIASHTLSATTASSRLRRLGLDEPQALSERRRPTRPDG